MSDKQALQPKAKETKGIKFYRADILRIMNAKPSRENVKYWFGLELKMTKTESLRIIWEKAKQVETAREEKRNRLAQELESKDQQIADLKTQHESQISALTDDLKQKDETIASLNAKVAELSAQSTPSEPKSDAEKFATAIFLLPDAIAQSALEAAFSQAEDIKKLYRQLARFFHPDTAIDKAQSQTIIRIFNHTYEQESEQREQRSFYSSGFVSAEEMARDAAEIPF